MKKIHNTRDGKSLPIPAMLDDHLTNMISIFYKQVMQLRASVALPSSPLEAELYGYSTVNAREAGQMIAAIIDEASPYLIEAYLRGLEGPRIMLQQMYNRAAPLPNIDLPALTLPGNWVDGYDDDNG